MYDRTEARESVSVQAIWEARREEQVTAAERVAEGLLPLLTKMVAEFTVGHSIRAAESMLARTFRQAVGHNVVLTEPGGASSAVYSVPRWHDCRRPPAEYVPLPDPLDPDHQKAKAQVAAAVASYAGELLRSGELGFVVYRGEAGTAAYTYCLRRVYLAPGTVPGTPVKQEGSSLRWDVVADDPDAPEGERRIYGDLEVIDGQCRIVKEQHVHHLRRVRERELIHFRDSKPLRVTRLLATLPQLVLPHLRVIEGTIVQEEEYGLDEDTGRIVATRIAKTWKDSPAVTLGDLVLTGWSSDDLAEERPSRLRRVGRVVLSAIGLFGLALVLAPFVLSSARPRSF